MTTDLTPMQTFEEKVKSRLKETIADMLPDEALAALVQRAVDEQFFKPRKTGAGTYHDPYKDAPGWFVEEVARLAKPVITQYVQKAFEDNKPAIESAIKAFVAEQNLALLMTTAITQNMSQMLLDTAYKIVQEVRR
jgi:hypothetical protein